MDNKALWKRAFTTDPRAVKPITGKQYSGNSPKPYWIVERLTDEFGPCGIGWGFTILNERFERFSDTDTLHIAVVRMWYMMDGKRGEFEQIGQTKSSYTTSKGSFMLDEDAPKKSVTDALVKCASYLGFAGDIFSGMWDDSKYVASANKEWRARNAADNASGDKKDMTISPTKEAAKANPITDAEVTRVMEIGSELVQLFDDGQETAALELWRSVTDNALKIHVWSWLKDASKLRSFLKANKA